MAVRLTDDRILVRVEEPETEVNGIIVPSFNKETTIEAVVVDVGPGKKTKSGKTVPLLTTQGDRVLFPKNSGEKVVLDQQEYLIVSESEMIGILY